MPSYRWTCNACESGNEASDDLCHNCGCASNAGGSEEIEKYSNPKKYFKITAREKYIRDLMFFFFIPFFAVVFVFSGNVVSLLFLAFSAFLLITKRSRLIKHIWNDIWARNTIVALTAVYTSIFLVRILFVSNDSELIKWLALLAMALPVFMYFYFFKSERGKNVFDRYYVER